MAKKKTENHVPAMLAVANKHYPERFIERYFNLATGEEHPFQVTENMGGDTLALFIGREIVGVSDDTASLEDNAANVVNALDTAMEEMRRVREAFEKLM